MLWECCDDLCLLLIKVLFENVYLFFNTFLWRFFAHNALNITIFNTFVHNYGITHFTSTLYISQFSKIYSGVVSVQTASTQANWRRLLPDSVQGVSLLDQTRASSQKGFARPQEDWGSGKDSAWGKAVPYRAYYPQRNYNYNGQGHMKITSLW